LSGGSYRLEITRNEKTGNNRLEITQARARQQGWPAVGPHASRRVAAIGSKSLETRKLATIGSKSLDISQNPGVAFLGDNITAGRRVVCFYYKQP
jgi:hypothetical protein